MKSHICRAFIIVVISGLLLSTTSSHTRPIAAQGQQPLPTATPLFQPRLPLGEGLKRTVTAGQFPLTQQGLAPNAYLIPIPLPPVETLSVPLGLTPEQIAEYTRGLAYQQARPIVAELAQLQTQGKIIHFEVQPHLFAVVVDIAFPPEVSIALAHLSGNHSIFPADKPIPACVEGAAQALKDEVAGLSQRPARQSHEAANPAGMLTEQATSPRIDVYAPAGNTWTYVAGSTTPATSVSFRILRNGSVIAVGATVSTEDGDYSFYPSYQSCPSGSYNWVLQAGDIVEITTAGRTLSTTVVNVSAGVDPVANTVDGTTGLGRSAEVRLYHYPTDSCSSTAYAQTVATNGNGAFSANFNSVVDFNRRASATIYARDANGNSTFASFYAYRIGAYFDSSGYWGYLKPNVAFVATLSRNGSVISTNAGTSNVRGYYYGYFDYYIQSGDVISVNGGGASLQYIATSLTNVALNPATNQVTGMVSPNRRVVAWFYKMDWGWPLMTTCSYNDSCASTVSNGSGNFALNAGIDLVRGDYAYIDIFDTEGNRQSSDQFSIPAIVANLTWNEVDGYWSVPNTNLTILLKDSDGTVIGSDYAWVDSYDNSFYAYPGTIKPTNKIEVGDGSITETMTVQNLTGRLQSNTGHLTGSAYNGHLLAQLWDFQRTGGYWYSYCSEINVSSGSYDLNFAGVQVGGQDESAVWSTGPDGHSTRRLSYAFSINAMKESNQVWGYSETPFTAITITVKMGGTTKALRTATTSSSGYYGVSGIPTLISQGDTVTVQTGDGNTAVVNVPELAVNKDVVNNRLYGRSPANEPIQVDLNRRFSPNSWYYYSFDTVANAAGNYSASFNDRFWSLDCSSVQVGNSCVWTEITYYNVSGHSVKMEQDQVSAPVDSYEIDSTAAAASDYTTVQHHTFHLSSDVDWIRFTVSPADVSNNISYRLETLNLGFGMDTYLCLYDTDGSTLLGCDDDSGVGLASAINWTPTAAGTYYLLATPFSASDTSYCDAAYDLLVLAVRARVFLPMTVKSNNTLSISYFAGPLENEPNNTIAQANGLLRSGQDYFGYPDDAKDYFSFLSNASGSITIDLTNYTGGNGQVQVFYQSTNNRVAYDLEAPFNIAYSGPAGLYYIYLNTGSNYNNTVPYALRVTYP